MTQPTKPTIDEQIAWVKTLISSSTVPPLTYRGVHAEAILATLERVKAAEAGLPVEPEYLIRLRNALKGFKSDGAFAGDKDIVDYIDSLQSALQRAQEERDAARKNYQFMVDRAADEKLDGYRELGAKCASLEERAEKAEAENAALKLDAERYRWQMDNPAIAFHYYKVRGFSDEYSAAIDQARAK